MLVEWWVAWLIVGAAGAFIGFFASLEAQSHTASTDAWMWARSEGTVLDANSSSCRE